MSVKQFKKSFDGLNIVDDSYKEFESDTDSPKNEKDDKSDKDGKSNREASLEERDAPEQKDLSFTRTVHLFNSWNENKLIKIGRDGQEIEPNAAQELCRLFSEDTSVNMTPILRKSKATSEQLKSKNRQFCNTRNEDNNECDDFRAIRKPLAVKMALARSENSHHERGYGGSGSRSRNRGYDNSHGIRMNRNNNLEADEMPPPIPSFYLTKLAKSLQTKFPDISDNSLSSDAIEVCLAKFMQSMSSQFPPLPYLPKQSSSRSSSSFMSSFPVPPPPPPPLPPPIPMHHVLGDDKSLQLGFRDRLRDRRRDRDRSRDRNYDNSSGNSKNRHRDHDRRIRERKRSPDWHRDRSQSNRSSRSRFDGNNKHYRSRLDDDRRHSRHRHNDF